MKVFFQRLKDTRDNLLKCNFMRPFPYCLNHLKKNPGKDFQWWLIVSQEDGTVVGMFAFEHRKECFYLSCDEIDQKFRKQGIYEQKMRFCEELARFGNYEYIECMADKHRTEVLIGKYGFEKHVDEDGITTLRKAITKKGENNGT